jgi:hypothetical protein
MKKIKIDRKMVARADQRQQQQLQQQNIGDVRIWSLIISLSIECTNIVKYHSKNELEALRTSGKATANAYKR